MNGVGRDCPHRGMNGGEYFPQDSDGVLTNVLDGIPIQEPWQSLVDATTRRIGEIFDQELDGLYLRGSVAAGRAWPRTSDIDFIALTREPSTHAAVIEQTSVSLLAAHPIAREVVIEVFDLQSLRNRSELAYMGVVLRVQSRFLTGADRRQEFPPSRPGPGMVYAARTLENRFNAFVALRQRPGSMQTVRLRTNAFFRACLRCGFELLESEIGRFTRDIDLCAQVLAWRYPDRADLFCSLYRRALSEPAPDDVATASEFMAWFIEERRVQLQLGGDA